MSRVPRLGGWEPSAGGPFQGHQDDVTHAGVLSDQLTQLPDRVEVDKGSVLHFQDAAHGWAGVIDAGSSHLGAQGGASLLGGVPVMTDGDVLLIEYSGSAAHVSAFAQALTDQGLKVRYARAPASDEQRGVRDPQTFVHAYELIEAWGSDHPLATGTAVTTAVYTRARSARRSTGGARGRLARAAEVTVKVPGHRAG